MKERERRVAAGLPAKPKPPKYIPKGLPVVNAMTRQDRDAESVSFDVASAAEMKEKINTQNEQEDTLRFGFDGLVMSDRVRKLLDLKNGSQKEVVSSQKRRGMELFQLREGDTVSIYLMCRSIHENFYDLSNGTSYTNAYAGKLRSAGGCIDHQDPATANSHGKT